MQIDPEKISARLSEVYQHNSLVIDREIGMLRIAMFSDLHKGQRDGADDFEQCEPAYKAGLGYYLERGMELALLGDIEELWENPIKPVLDSYKNIFIEEQKIASLPDRYIRVVGNHDDLWYDPHQVEKHLGSYIHGSPVVEGVRLRVRDGGQVAGELFLVHGHQGTFDSEVLAPLSKWLLRHFWRPIQRLLRIKVTTPSNDFKLKQEHELALYAWAVTQPGVVLIAGHTHHPVWEGLSYRQAMVKMMVAKGMEADLSSVWQPELKGKIDLPGEKPCYFNTGCGSFNDGSATAIEIEDGEIRLVRWTGGSEPMRALVFNAPLLDVFQAVSEP